MYKNKNTSAILTDKEYWHLRRKEVRGAWDNMTEKERLEWGTYKEYEKWDLERNVDLDFEYIED